MNAFSLARKTVFVTGASSGIGRQICITASNHGATIVASGRNEDELDKTLEMLDGKERAHVAIAGDLSEIDKLADFAKQLPKLDGVVHCAGIAKYVPFKIISEKDVRATQILNYEAPLLLTQTMLKSKLINRGGSIVFIASISALVGVVANSLYAGSKGALVAASRALAIETAGMKIRANCISPGMIKTPLTEKMQESFSADTFNEKEKLHPLGFGTTEDVGNAAVFLLSDAGRWITGSNLIVDGGYTCQ